MESGVEVSVVIPCLNEARTVGDVVGRVKIELGKLGVSHEVVVADNGSTDGSAEAATAAGARVVDASGHRGVGAATRFGVGKSSGRAIVLMDADGEHDPGDLGGLLAGLAANPTALVLGSRYKGKFLKGASSLPNRLIGTPALTLLLNHYFGTRITDCNTGYRAMARSTFDLIDVQTPGFEFCSEMIALAALRSVPIVEVPITQHPGPPGRTPHLRRMRDGWRHLRLILLHAPDRVLLRPGLVSLALGALLVLPQLGGRFEVGPIAMDIHLMILGSLLLFIGVEMIGAGILSAAIAGEPLAPSARLSRRLGRRFGLDDILPAAAAIFLLGLICDVAVIVISASNGWTGITEPRLALLGTTAMAIAVQLLVLSFVHSVVSQHIGARQKESALAVRAASTPSERLEGSSALP